MNKMDWIRFKEIKPSDDGLYLVAYSEPYSREPSYRLVYWKGDNFINSYAGGNEILFWKDFSKLESEEDLDYREREINKMCGVKWEKNM